MNAKALSRQDAKKMRNNLGTNGARLWSQTQPQRIGIAEMLRLVLRTQSRSEALRLRVFASLR